MSLLHIIGSAIFFSVLAVIVLTLLTWTTRSKSEPKPTSLAELQEDKAEHINRISAGRSYSAARQDLKREQEKRRA